MMKKLVKNNQDIRKIQLRKYSKIIFISCIVSVMISGCTIYDRIDKHRTDSDLDDENQEVMTNMDNGYSKTSQYIDRSNGFEERITIKIPVYDRAWQGWNPTDNYWTKWIQENFGDKYNINVEFVSIGRSAEVINFKQLLAAGTAPDIIFHFDYPNILDYYLEGAFQTIDSKELEFYAPSYWKNRSEDILKYGVINNEIKILMGDRVELLSKNYVTIIRQDWIDEVNMEMPKSLEEYNNLLLAWKSAGLGYATASLKSKSFNYDYSFREWPADYKERALNSDLAVASFTWKATHDFLLNLNQQWNNDLISKEFYLDTDGSKAKADFISGKAGVWGGFIYSTSLRDIENLLANEPDAKLSVLDPLALVPKSNHPQQRRYWPFGMLYGINTNTSTEARQAIYMYLEWLSQAENLYTLQNGFEGVHFEFDKNQLPISLANTGKKRLSSNDNADYWCLINANKVYGSDKLNELAAVNSYGPLGYEYLIEDTIAYTNKYSMYYSEDIAYSVPIESVSEYEGDLSSLFQELYVKVVTCKPSEFEEVYKNACELYLSSGYQDILNEKEAAFDRGLFHQ